MEVLRIVALCFFGRVRVRNRARSGDGPRLPGIFHRRASADPTRCGIRGTGDELGGGRHMVGGRWPVRPPGLGLPGGNNTPMGRAGTRAPHRLFFGDALARVDGRRRNRLHVIPSGNDPAFPALLFPDRRHATRPVLVLRFRPPSRLRCRRVGRFRADGIHHLPSLVSGGNKMSSNECGETDPGSASPHSFGKAMNASARDGPVRHPPFLRKQAGTPSPAPSAMATATVERLPQHATQSRPPTARRFRPRQRRPQGFPPSFPHPLHPRGVRRGRRRIDPRDPARRRQPVKRLRHVLRGHRHVAARRVKIDPKASALHGRRDVGGSVRASIRFFR